MNNTGLLLIGVAAILLLSRQQGGQSQGGFNPGSSYVPPMPDRRINPQAFQVWVQSILNTYGAVSELWQPGGPFYNAPVDIQDYTQQTWTTMF